MPDGLEQVPTNMEEVEQLFLEKMETIKMESYYIFSGQVQK